MDRAHFHLSFEFRPFVPSHLDTVLELSPDLGSPRHLDSPDSVRDCASARLSTPTIVKTTCRVYLDSALIISKTQMNGLPCCTDTTSDFVVCANYLGSPYGTTSPATSDPRKPDGGVIHSHACFARVEAETEVNNAHRIHNMWREMRKTDKNRRVKVTDALAQRSLVRRRLSHAVHHA